MIFYVKLTIFVLMLAFIMAQAEKRNGYIGTESNLIPLTSSRRPLYEKTADYDLCMRDGDNTYAELTGSMLQEGQRKAFEEFTTCGCFKTTAKPGIDPLVDDVMIAYYFAGHPGEQAYVPCGKGFLAGISSLPSGIDDVESLCDGRWHHGCSTYSASTGLSITYLDYCFQYGGFNITFSDSEKMPLDLSDVQDDQVFGSIGGVFDGTKDYNFHGCGTGINMYSRALTVEEVIEHCKKCDHDDGDIFKWSDAGAQLRGTVIPVRPSDASNDRGHYNYSRKIVLSKRNN